MLGLTVVVILLIRMYRIIFVVEFEIAFESS